jgi:predicted RNase H-like HicB family nuclease
LHVIFYKDKEDGDIVIAKCNALCLATHGDDLTDAMRMFDECFSLWAETVNDYYETEETLKNLGWIVNDTLATFSTNLEDETNRIKEDYQVYNVPVNILSNKSLNISLPVWSA